jgi:hypothetical protein
MGWYTPHRAVRFIQTPASDQAIGAMASGLVPLLGRPASSDAQQLVNVALGCASGRSNASSGQLHGACLRSTAD